jgi:hypothetical protein
MQDARIKNREFYVLQPHVSRFTDYGIRNTEYARSHYDQENFSICHD